MHQRPLRTFVTRMMNQYATITKKPKNKPGYNQPDMKPSWWPSTSEWYHPKGTIQYANLDSLRAIVRHCFNHFGIQSDFVPPLEEHDSSLNSDISHVSSPAHPPSPSGSTLNHNSMDVTSQTEEPNLTHTEDGNENSIGSNVDDQMNSEDLDDPSEPTFTVLANMDPYAARPSDPTAEAIVIEEPFAARPSDPTSEAIVIEEPFAAGPSNSDPTEDIVIVLEKEGQVEFKSVITKERVQLARLLDLKEDPKKIDFARRSKDLKYITDKSRKQPIQGDGSCFFRSINFILTGSETAPGSS